MTLFSTGKQNTGMKASYGADPLMNLYFMRDQVITTARGVVVGHFNAAQREPENRLVRYAYEKLGVKPVYQVTGSARLEGGDFIPAGDTALIGQGLRTNAEAILAIDGVSDGYKKRLADAGVDAVWMDFSNLTGGYGAAHCTTQVIQRGN